MSIGASPSGKAPGFGPGISEVRVLPPQPIKSSLLRAFLLTNYFLLFLAKISKYKPIAKAKTKIIPNIIKIVLKYGKTPSIANPIKCETI